jgi:DNA-binding CsgD family transcriptional regulator
MDTPKKEDAALQKIGYCDYPPQETRRSLPDYGQGVPAAAPPVTPAGAGQDSPVVTTAHFTADPRLEKALLAVLNSGAGESGGRSSGLPALARRERQTLLLAAQGLSNEEIAQSLHLRPITVVKALSRVYRKLGARNRAEAVHKYLPTREEGDQ